MRILAGVVVAAVLAASGGKAAVGAADPVGDTTGPDIVEVTATNTTERLLVDVKLANRPSLAAGDVVFVDVDADRNAGTGVDGVDYYAAFEGAAEAPVDIHEQIVAATCSASQGAIEYLPVSMEI